MKPSCILLSLLLLFATSASGQDIKVIQGATLFDGTGRPPLKDAVIVIQGSRIKQVGTKGEVKVPSGAEIIDARGRFVIPGLSDMHNHLDSDSIGITQKAQDFTGGLKRMLGWGFTIIFDPASRNLSSLAELKRISRPDTAPYPHYFAIGRTFGAKQGHGPQTKYTPETTEEARAAVREVKSCGDRCDKDLLHRPHLCDHAVKTNAET